MTILLGFNNNGKTYLAADTSVTIDSNLKENQVIKFGKLSEKVIAGLAGNATDGVPFLKQISILLTSNDFNLVDFMNKQAPLHSKQSESFVVLFGIEINSESHLFRFDSYEGSFEDLKNGFIAEGSGAEEIFEDQADSLEHLRKQGVSIYEIGDFMVGRLNWWCTRERKSIAMDNFFSGTATYIFQGDGKINYQPNSLYFDCIVQNNTLHVVLSYHFWISNNCYLINHADKKETLIKNLIDFTANQNFEILKSQALNSHLENYYIFKNPNDPKIRSFHGKLPEPIKMNTQYKIPIEIQEHLNEIAQKSGCNKIEIFTQKN